jgi:Zn-dependent protease
MEMRSDILMLLYAIPAILFSLSFHEMAHAYTSYRLGDPTAKRLGRLTLNPLKHLDPVGTLMLLVSMYSGFGFGWAKPVPIDPTYYKNYKKGTVMVSLAGPLSNLLLAFLFSFPMALIASGSGLTRSEIYSSTYLIYGADFSFRSVVFNISRMFYMINIGLAIFNLIPIPPLDGSKILMGVLPARTYFTIMGYERYIGLLFLALMVLRPGILSTVTYPLRRAVELLFGLVGSLII